MLGMLGEGALAALQIFIYTLLGALPLGMLVALGRVSRFAPLRWLMRFYISVMRGTPLMVQLFIVYFGPWTLLGLQLGRDYMLPAVLIAFILNYAAYFGEIYRGGIASIPRGQREAAEVLGYSRAQTFIRIILPQVFKRILPALSNEVITLVKDTSLAFTIGFVELMSQAKTIVNSTADLTPLLIAAAIYYFFALFIAFIMECHALALLISVCRLPVVGCLNTGLKGSPRSVSNLLYSTSGIGIVRIPASVFGVLSVFFPASIAITTFISCFSKSMSFHAKAMTSAERRPQ